MCNHFVTIKLINNPNTMIQNLRCNNPKCNAPLNNTDFWCSLKCCAEEYGVKSAEPNPPVVEDLEGCVFAEDYAYGDVAAENCSSL